MEINNLNRYKSSISFKKIYKLFICLLIISSLTGSKLFGIQVGGFTLFMDRIILFIILFLFWPRITNRLLIYNKSIYLFIPMILISIISLASQTILGMNQGYIMSTVKLLALYIEFSLFMAIIYIAPQKQSINKLFVYVMYMILIIGILESFGVKILNSDILPLLPKTEQQYKDLNIIFYRGETIRISSFYTHSLAFGTVLSLYIPYLYYLYKNSILSKLSFIISLILTNYCLFLTYSRTALVMTISFYIFLIIRNIMERNKSILIKTMYCFIVIICSYLAINIIVKNIDIFFPQGKNDKSIYMRLEDYQFVKEGIEQSPIIGLGSGAYRNNYNNAIDNFYLTTLYENGLVGLFLLTAFIYVNVIYLKKEINGKESISIKYIFFMLILYNLTMDAFGFIEIMKFYLIMIALSSRSYTKSKNTKYRRKINI